MAHGFSELEPLPEIQLLKAEVSTAFPSMPPRHFCSVMTDHGIYHLEAAPILSSGEGQANHSLQKRDATGGDWGGAWPGAAGPCTRSFSLVPGSRKGRNRSDIVCILFVWHCVVTKQYVTFV